ncbi:hypothetical protein [uncultured Pontibacter sp.]|uniref:hypothetical protein n=1 Tax=uncultured Pontibacter sp. TaxID=453356 RepID=UPI00262E27A5|nr:hypothetical protein [uncultured Pontibacter sp.]
MADSSKSNSSSNSLKEDNPCWKGYEPVGTKKKDGKEVPNCVPKNKASGSGSSKSKS